MDFREPLRRNGKRAGGEGGLMSARSLTLLVLRTSQMEVMKAFYRALGLVLTEEQHGSGPVHCSTQLGSTVLEIYPGEPASSINRKGSGATMLGLSVESVDATIVRIQALGSLVVTAPTDSAWGRRAVLLDPDGRSVEISEPKKV